MLTSILTVFNPIQRQKRNKHSDEMSTPNEEFPAPYIISFITEFIGTAIMEFFGCAGCYKTFKIGPVTPAFSFAFAILLSLQLVGHFSPCHINPAVSLGFLIMGKMPIVRFIVYVIAQFLGSLCGFTFLWLLVPPLEDFCLLKVKMGTVTQAFFLEMIGTMLLMWLVLGATDAACTALYNDSKYLRIIFGVGGIIFSIETFTGCGINTARALPPPIFYNNWTDQWLFLVAPLAGGAIGAVFYRFVLSNTEHYSFHSFLLRQQGATIH